MRLALRTHLIHWQSFRVFFDFSILRYFVLWFSVVPLFVAVFGDIPEKVRVGIGGETLIVNLRLSFSWMVLWTASLCYTLALLIYQFACPAFIKQYHNFGEYLTHAHSPRWIAWLVHYSINTSPSKSKLFTRLQTKGYVSTSQRKPQRVPDDQKKYSSIIVREASTIVFFSETASFEMPRPGDNSDAETTLAEREVFWEIFGEYAAARPLVRSVICFLLAVAAVCFLIVLVEHIWPILNLVFHRSIAVFQAAGSHTT